MPYDERDDDSGQFTPEFRDDDFVDAARSTTGTTSAIADAVGCKYRTAYQRLTVLEEDGRVESTKVGSSLLWDAVDDATPRVHGSETPTQDADSAADTYETARDISREIFDGDAYTEPIPGDVDRDDLLDAIDAALSHLEAVGAAKKPEFVREVMPDHAMKYDAEAAIAKIDAGERERGKWWRLVRDGLASHPKVHKPENNARPWRYINRAE